MHIGIIAQRSSGVVTLSLGFGKRLLVLLDPFAHFVALQTLVPNLHIGYRPLSMHRFKERKVAIEAHLFDTVCLNGGAAVKDIQPVLLALPCQSTIFTLVIASASRLVKLDLLRSRSRFATEPS